MTLNCIKKKNLSNLNLNFYVKKCCSINKIIKKKKKTKKLAEIDGIIKYNHILVK
jgi:hypothetical protein